MSKQMKRFLLIIFMLMISYIFSKNSNLKTINPRCYAPTVYSQINDSNQPPTCKTKLVQDYFDKDFKDKEMMETCLNKYEFMDANRNYDIDVSCKRRSRFDVNIVYEGQALSDSTGDDYLNSAKLIGRLIETNGEYIYKIDNSANHGFIALTHAPLGNPEDIMNDPKFNCGGNNFTKIEGKDCLNRNLKKNGKYDKDNTVLSFYKNLQKNKIEYIIMLTNYVEKKTNDDKDCNCELKADKYYPFNESETFNIKNPDHVTDSGSTVKAKRSPEELKRITNDTTNIDEILEVRELFFYNKSNGSVHQVFHIHYKGWPDFGVPEGRKKDILLDLIAFARKMSDEKKNIIVHCTGGIGRTGTFVASILTSKLKKNVKFNLFKFITEIRKLRPKLIEKDSQIGLIRENMKKTPFII